MVGKNIKRDREAKGITQEELAVKLNVTRQAVSSWETGKTQPDVELLVKIAQNLDVSVEELIYGAGRKYDPVLSESGNVVKKAAKGISFGSALAMVISYVKWKSVGWAILHGLLNWIYVVYFVCRYGRS